MIRNRIILVLVAITMVWLPLACVKCIHEPDGYFMLADNICGMAFMWLAFFAMDRVIRRERTRQFEKREAQKDSEPPLVTANMNSQWRFRDSLMAIRGTLICLLIILFFDVVDSGCYLMAALICPILLLVGMIRSLVRRESLGVAAARILLPAVTLLIAIANYDLQVNIATANAARVVEACDRYCQANGTYPYRLQDLVPRYLSSVPHAKYCTSWNDFWYFRPQYPIVLDTWMFGLKDLLRNSGSPYPMLWWVKVPPFGRMIYGFDNREWSYLD